MSGFTEFTEGKGEIFTISEPEMSDWQCRLTRDAVYRPQKGNEPNWFWRKMQYLCFGFKWEKG